MCELTEVLKVSAMKEHKLPWMADVYIQITHRVTGSNLDFSFSSSSSQVYYYSLSYACDLFQVLPTPFVVTYLCNMAISAAKLYAGCDMKICLRHASRD